MNKMTIALATLFAISHPAISLAAESAQSAKARSQTPATQPINQRGYPATSEKPRIDCDARRNPETECKEFAEQNRKRNNGQSVTLESSRP
jgi:hypothetical protein